MRRYELDGRRINISPALEPDERFDRKRLGYIKSVINKKKGIELHWIQKNFQRKSITINGQTVAMIDASGLLRYNKYEHVEDKVQKHMEKWLTKIIATTLSSRETGMERRNEMVTTSSHEETYQKKQHKIDRIHISLRSKDSKKVFFTGSKEDMTNKGTRKAATCNKNKKNREHEEAEAVQDKAMDTWKAKGGSIGSSKNSPQT